MGMGLGVGVGVGMGVGLGVGVGVGMGVGMERALVPSTRRTPPHVSPLVLRLPVQTREAIRGPPLP